MDPFTIILIGGAIAASIAAAGGKARAPEVAQKREAVQAMAEPVAQAAAQGAAKAGVKVAIEAKAAGAPQKIVSNILKGTVAVGVTIALLKGLSARRAREDLAYARKQWVKDVLGGIAQLKAVELTGKSDIDIFRFILTWHPPLYPGPPVEAAAKSIATGGTIYLEHTGWSPLQTLYRVREKLGVAHPPGPILVKWTFDKNNPLPPKPRSFGAKLRWFKQFAARWPFTAPKWVI